VISSFIKHVDRKHGIAALIVLLLVLCSPGCGSSSGNFSDGQLGTAKAKPVEELYRYEGTGKAKQKTRIRRQDERHKELMKAKENG
jgi:hypothetical protein